MIKSNRITIVLVAIMMAICGCKKDDNGLLETNINPNLVVNGSFESDTSFSIAHWTVDGLSTLLAKSTDIPTSGGRFSVDLKWAGLAYLALIQTIAAEPGHHVYQFSYFAKSHYSGATVYFGKMRSRDSSTVYYSHSFQEFHADSLWILYSSVDTLDTADGDSLFVELQADLDGAPHRIPSGTLFDLVQVLKLK